MDHFIQDKKMDYEKYIIKDTGWYHAPNANPRRGWHSYLRIIALSPDVPQDILFNLSELLDKDPKCPAGQGRVSRTAFTDDSMEVMRFINSADRLTRPYYLEMFSCYLDSSD